MKINSLRLSSITLILGGVVFVSSCSQPKEVEKLTFLSKIVITNEDTTDGSQKFEGEAHSGKYFSHTDSLGKYGSTAVYKVPDSLMQTDIKVKVNMWVRQGDFNDKNQFAVSLEAPDNNIIQWSQIVMQPHITETHKWINVIDSVTIAGDLINKSGLIIKMFPFNPTGNSFMDVDDIELTIFKSEKTIE